MGGKLGIGKDWYVDVGFVDSSVPTLRIDRNGGSEKPLCAFGRVHPSDADKELMQLLSAAPELLEACKEAVRELMFQTTSGCVVPGTMKALSELRAAIAKAEDQTDKQEGE